MITRQIRRLGMGSAGLALTLAACGGGAPEEAPVIAEVAGEPVRLDEFQAVLRRSLEGAAERAPDGVKSRLLDQFLEERLLLAEAGRRGIEPAPELLERAVREFAGEGEPVDPALRQEVRASLLVRALLRAVVEESSPITPAEENAYYRDHTADFHRPAVLQVRQILLDDAAAAEEVMAEIRRDPDRFAELAAVRSLSPDRGRLLVYSPADLPETVAAALAGLKRGQVTPVLEHNRQYLIFRLEESREERALTLEEARAEIRARLLEERGQGAVAELLPALRQRLGLRLRPENLPFRYVTEEPT